MLFTWSRRGAAVVIALGIGLGAGCTAAPPPPAPVPAPAPAVAPPVDRPDLRAVLVDPAELPVPDLLLADARPLAEDAVDGVVASYQSADGERQLGVTIVLLPDPVAARDALRGAAESTAQQRSGARSAPAQVGDEATIFTGYRLAGTSSTLLLFSQGRASVAMEFRTPDAAAVPAGDAVEAGRRQAARLQATIG